MVVAAAAAHRALSVVLLPQRTPAVMEPPNLLRAVAADNRREYGIQRVQQRLATAKDGRPRLFLCEEALEEVDLSLQERRQPVSTEQEFASYVYPMGKDGRPVAETPVEENDHGMDAMRYAVMWVEEGGRGAGEAGTQGVLAQGKTRVRLPRSGWRKGGG